MAKKTPEINSSSTADMAFLLLCFFMMTTTMDTDKGLQRRLPPIPPKEQNKNNEINRRNIIVVRINAADRVLAGTKPIQVSELKERIKEFLVNEDNRADLPERKLTPIEGWIEYVNGKAVTKSYPISQGVISLQNDRGTSYKEYIAVQNELVKAINELRDEFALQHFQKAYKKCDDLEKSIINKAIPQNISEAEPKDISKQK